MKRVCCLLALILALPVLAQEELLQFRGVVINAQGEPWAGATVTLETEGQAPRSVVVDGSGEFVFEGIPPGSYRLTVQAEGFATFTQVFDLDRRVSRGMLLLFANPEGGWDVRLEEPREALPPPPPPPMPPPPEDKGYAEVEVFYGTDRALQRNKPVEERFGPARSRWTGLHRGVCKVSVPRDHRMGEIERPSIWKLEVTPDPRKHMVLLGLEELGQNGFYKRLQGNMTKSGGRELLVFVHGYNVTFHDAVLRTAQLAYDLGIDGAPVLYSWPSRASLSDYTRDEATIGASVFALEPFLRELAARSGARSIYLVAHSMGNRALTRALERIALGMRQGAKPMFSEIILTAPDIDAREFASLAQTFRRAGERVTLYASSKDGALKASKQVHGFARAGDTDPDVLVLSGIDTVDVSQVDTSLLGHSYFGDNCSVIADMKNLLRHRKPPQERSPLTRKEKGPGLLYWVFPAGASCPTAG
ncbi:MAG TPA: alpha/beta hydrolase [Thermoanaerobaculia bacterium]|nr:alpha/beta hydrolase [Thermoanaerobaculia bacterium]